MQDIGVRVGVQGEQQYKQAIANIVQTSKELNAEMKAMVSGFESTTSAQEQARSKMDLLNKQIQNQEKYIETLTSKYKSQESTLNSLKNQLDKANAEYGEGSKESQKLTKQINSQENAMSKTRTTINSATTALNGMKQQMSALDPVAKGAASSTDELADAVEDAGDSASNASSGWSTFKQIVADFASSAIHAAINAVKDLAKEAINVNDSMIKFENTMAFAGFGKAQIQQTSEAMKAYADKTVYSLKDVSNVVAQLGANGVDNFEKLVEAAGNLNAAAGGSAESFGTFGLVLTQTAGVGKLTAENWKQLMNAIPGASGKIQEALQNAGAYVGSFQDAMKDGEITAEEFNAAILQVGSQPMAVEAATSATTFEAKLAQLKTKGIDIIANALNILSPAIDLAFSAIDAILTPIAKLAEALAGGSSKMDTLTSSAQNLTNAVDEWAVSQEAIDEEYAISQGLIDVYKGRLFDLEDQYWKAKAAGEDTTDITREYNAIIEILNENIPDLNLTINEQNGLLDGNSRKILENSNAWIEAQKAQAWQEQFTDVLLAQAMAEAELQTNRTRLKIATDDYNEATKKSAELQAQLDELWDEFYSGAAEDPEALKQKIDEVSEAWEAENLKVKDAEEQMNDYSTAVKKGEEAMEDINAEVEEAQRVYDALINSQANYASKTGQELGEIPAKWAQAARDSSWAWNSNLSIKQYSVSKGGFETISAYKTGLAYVPYDGFIAELHKGERILTAAEAAEYRNMRSPEAYVPVTPSTPDLSTINNNNQQTSVVLNVYGADGQDEEALADIVMDRIQRSINRQEAVYGS